jgi:hypothetical protein
MVGPSPRSGEAEAPPRSRLSPSPGVGRGGDRCPRSRLSPSPGVGRGGDRRPRSRLSPSPRVDLAAVSLTLVGGTAVGAVQAALFSCQVSQWRGEVTAVTSALSTEERVLG